MQIEIKQPLAVDHAKVRCPSRPKSWDAESKVTVTIPDPDTVDGKGNPALSARATMKIVDDAFEAIERKNRVIERQADVYDACRDGALKQQPPTS